MMVWLTPRTHGQYLDSVSAHPSTPPNNTHISECSGCSEQPYYNLQSPPQLNIMMFINIHYLFINIQTLWIFMTYMNMYDLYMNINKSVRYLSFMLWTSSNLHELVCIMHLCEQLYIYRCVFYGTSVEHRTTSLGVIILWKIGPTCISLVMLQWINIQEGGRNISLIVSSWNTRHKWQLK